MNDMKNDFCDLDLDFGHLGSHPRQKQKARNYVGGKYVYYEFQRKNG